MITVLIAGNNISDNERIASSIVGGTELTTCIICTRSACEAQKIAESDGHQIDLFIISIKLQEQSGHRLAEKIRTIMRYRNVPILFVTSASYSLSGLSERMTYQSYKRCNYISLPLERIDIQSKLGLYLEEIILKQSLENHAERAVYIKHSKGGALVLVKNILFAEAQNKCCRLVTTDGIYLVGRKSLCNLINIVGDPFFLRCHRGFALNVKQLKGIEKIERRIWKAVFDNRQELCFISKTYMDSILRKYTTLQTK